MGEYKPNTYFEWNNPDMALLISEATLDLDSYIFKKKSDVKSIETLAEMLEKVSKRKFIDPTTSNLIVKSVGEKYFKLGHTDEILYQLNLATRELKLFRTASNERLRELRKFLLNLSKETISVQNSYLRRYRSRGCFG